MAAAKWSTERASNASSGGRGPNAAKARTSGRTELRHYCALLPIRHGESVKTVQARLVHASASETLDTYSHRSPDHDERTRAAVDGVLRNLADLFRTNGGEETHHRRSGA
ncbi:hypothetical protein GCM10023258_15540 [Terrabacter aeriphilus]|uniref:Phage integrase family protein n=1 Tax=Terrabacter aeriphilus TaxID=515662 RepID=A0ABP9JA56_9MICO